MTAHIVIPIRQLVIDCPPFADAMEEMKRCRLIKDKDGQDAAFKRAMDAYAEFQRMGGVVP